MLNFITTKIFSVFVIGHVLIAIQSSYYQIYNWLFSRDYKGIIFLGPDIKIRHQILNILGTQSGYSLVVGDGYNKINCKTNERFSVYNIFIYANTEYNYKEQNYSLSLCTEQRLDIQVSNILYATNYTKPICIEIFGENANITSGVLQRQTSRGLIITHSISTYPIIKDIESEVFLYLLSPFVNDPLYRFVYNILLNPYSSSITDIKDQTINMFTTKTSESELCADSDIFSFQDSMVRKLILFYHSINHQLYPSSHFSIELLTSTDVLPSWYSHLQQKSLPIFKRLLMIYYVSVGNVHNVKCLLDSGVYIDSSLSNGVTPLIISIAKQDTSMMKLCLDMGSNVNISRSNGITPLMTAVNNNDLKTTEIVLDKEPDIDAQDERGFTALMYAVKKQEEKMVELLLSYNADPSVLDNQKQSTLDMAKKLNNERIISALETYSRNNDHIDDSSSICSGMSENIESLE